MHVPKGEIKMIIIESVHWLSQRGLITFHSMDVEGKTIRKWRLSILKEAEKQQSCYSTFIDNISLKDLLI